MNDVAAKLQERIGGWKKSLLDMSKRNRLLWYKPYRVGSLKIDENIFDDPQPPIIAVQDLITNGGSIQFNAELPVLPAEPKEGDANYEENKKEYDSIKKSADKIKSRNSALEIIRRKIKSENDEKGLNIGYIAVGFLKWYEREDSSSEISSPLIMIPVVIEQDSRKTPFKIVINADEEIAINPVVNKKFESDFNINLNTEEYDFTDLNSALDSIANKIKSQEGWRVSNEVVLDTFNFQNLVIWNDFEKNAELIFSSPFGKILGGETTVDAGITYDEGEIDLKQMKSQENLCILETDSSQLEAIYRARNGESFVIQGPPGTGKSQTITNIIAEQLFLGKKVLFVSEKQAALDVVYHKLQQKGLSDFCLIMHNAKQRKTDVREQLRNSLELAADKKRVSEEAMQVLQRLDEKKDNLNLYADELHVKYRNGISPYEAMGELAKLQNEQDLAFNLPEGITVNADYDEVVKKAFERIEAYSLSFIDNTRHFDTNLWRSYTGEFSNSTRRTVEEAIGSIDLNDARAILDKFEADRDILDISAYLQQIARFVAIFDKIPFRQVDTSEIKTELENIELFNKGIADSQSEINLNNKTKKKIDSDTKAQTEAMIQEVSALKNELSQHFTEDFIELKNTNDLYKKLTNKYRSMFSRLSGDYRKLIEQLESYSTSKLKYKDYVKYLGMRVEIDVKNSDIKKLEAQASDKKKQIDKDNGHLENKISKMNSDIYMTATKVHDALVRLLSDADQLLTNLDFNRLQEYQTYQQARLNLIDNYGLSDFVEKIEDKEKIYQTDQILGIFKKRYFTLFLEGTEFAEKYYNYSRDEHDRDINKFREYDTKALKVASLRVQSKLLSELPDVSGFSNSRQSGEIGLLRRELKKKSRLLSTRKLIEKLPITIPQIKPCMMMSPLTVSSYFGTNTDWKFDVVIFDEASQVKPEYAVPAIVRGEQIIIAGDSKQMPPTRFFDSAYFDDELDDNVELSDLESILDEMSTMLPDMYLNWHYRSKDESLITFSNRSFYNNRLFTFPSVYNVSDGVGVNHIYCEDGIWESKNGNRIEAERVARIVFDHILQQPERSLGVIAFGKSQEYAIFEAVNKVRDMHPELEHFFSETKDEPFFIKNLENVQGDERDRIILSCGYGKDANGTFAMRFGPLALAGGERRLNVAVSRAKYQMTVVSSFKASEIRGTDENPNRKLLRDFIDYSERGLPALIGDSSITKNYEPEFDSDFEEEVYNFIIQNGYQLRTQVGSSGYRIDMAILHPEIEGRFVLAIECDGAAYHSSRTARDRDILRQEILENLGWKFYRIWSTNWINDNDNEKRRLLAAIELAVKDYLNTQERTSKSSNTEVEEDNLTETYDVEDNLEVLYKEFRKQLIAVYGNGYYNKYGHLEDSWNSLYVMEHSGVIEKILKEAVKSRSGYSPEDLFREINYKVFDKTRYTAQAEAIYKKAFNKLTDNKTLEVVGGSIRAL